MKKIKRILCALCALALVPVMRFNVYADVPDVVVSAKESVVRVFAGVVNDDGTPDFGATGTAFVVAHDGTATYLVTNRHVVTATLNDGSEVEWPAIRIVQGDLEKTLLVAEVTYMSDHALDLVVLRVNTGLGKLPVLPLADSSTVSQGKSCYALGFPGVKDELAELDKDYRTLPSRPDDVTITEGIITSMSESSKVLDQKVYFTSATINHGNSGGPLMNSKGEVVGVNTYGNETVFSAIYIDYIIADCVEWGIKIEQAAAAFNPVDNPVDNPADATETPAPTATAAPETAKDSNMTLYIAIGAVVAVIIVAAVIIAVLGKKKAPAAPVSSGASPMTTPVMSTPAGSAASGIRGLSGPYAGNYFAVNASLVIGRDPKRCNVVFDANAKEISSLHCEVRRAASGLELVDRGSTNGTYLDDGTKLTPNVPMPLGARKGFYLANKGYMFTVQ